MRGTRIAVVFAALLGIASVGLLLWVVVQLLGIPALDGQVLRSVIVLGLLGAAGGLASVILLGVAAELSADGARREARRTRERLAQPRLLTEGKAGALTTQADLDALRGEFERGAGR